MEFDQGIMHMHMHINIKYIGGEKSERVIRAG